MVSFTPINVPSPVSDDSAASPVEGQYTPHPHVAASAAADALALADIYDLLPPTAAAASRSASPLSNAPPSVEEETTTGPSQGSERNIRGVLTDGTPAVARFVCYQEVREWRQIKACYDNNEVVPDNLDELMATVNHRVRHEMKRAYRDIVTIL